MRHVTKLFHMSDTLQLGAEMTLDDEKQMELVLPFVQALECGKNCFYAMYLNAKYLRAVLGKFQLRDMRLFDEAYNSMWKNEDLSVVLGLRSAILRR